MSPLGTPAIHAKELDDEEPIAAAVLSSEPVEEASVGVPSIVEPSVDDVPVRLMFLLLVTFTDTYF